MEFLFFLSIHSQCCPSNTVSNNNTHEIFLLSICWFTAISTNLYYKQMYFTVWHRQSNIDNQALDCTVKKILPFPGSLTPHVSQHVHSLHHML